MNGPPGHPLYDPILKERDEAEGFLVVSLRKPTYRPDQLHRPPDLVVQELTPRPILQDLDFFDFSLPVEGYPCRHYPFDPQPHRLRRISPDPVDCRLEPA